jgi:metal-responsive CopG/Arc/MetJ family transcriptional regulator
MRPRRILDPTRASIFLENNDVIELDRIRAARGESRNSLLRQAIKQFIAAQQNAA